MARFLIALCLFNLALPVHAFNPFKGITTAICGFVWKKEAPLSPWEFPVRQKPNEHILYSPHVRSESLHDKSRRTANWQNAVPEGLRPKLRFLIETLIKEKHDHYIVNFHWGVDEIHIIFHLLERELVDEHYDEFDDHTVQMAFSVTRYGKILVSPLYHQGHSKEDDMWNQVFADIQKHGKDYPWFEPIGADPAYDSVHWGGYVMPLKNLDDLLTKINKEYFLSDTMWIATDIAP